MFTTMTMALPGAVQHGSPARSFGDWMVLGLLLFLLLFLIFPLLPLPQWPHRQSQEEGKAAAQGPAFPWEQRPGPGKNGEERERED